MISHSVRHWVISVGEAFCIPKDVFMDSKEGMGDHPLTQMSHLLMWIFLKYLYFFWYFSMQTMESIVDATTRFHTST